MKPHSANVRMVVLAGAAILLGSWNLIGWTTDPVADPSSSGPSLEPEVIGAQASPSGVKSDLRTMTGPSGPGQPAHDGGQMDPAAILVPASVRQERFLAGSEGAFAKTLDRVFAPDRVVGGAAVGTASAPRHGQTDQGSFDADGGGRTAGAAFIASGGGSGGGSGPPATDPGTDPQTTAHRLVTEKDYYEDYRALAKQDAGELERRAEAILKGNSESCQKVAMLRALYESDHVRALDHFTQAIATLPDRSRPEGASVPAFAVTFLGQQVNDPAVKGVVERIAWTGYLNVSPELQRQAADALLAKATEADLKRYASYPAYQQHHVATSTESDTTR